MNVSSLLSLPVLPLGQSTHLEVQLNFGSGGQAGLALRRPLNLSVVIDRSGSMCGAPLKYAVKAAQDLVDRMTADDLLSVVIYDDDVETIVPPQPVADRAALKATIGKIRAGGCTNLHGGWKMGLENVKAHQSDTRVNRVLLLTDGQANVGERSPEKIIPQAEQWLAKGIATTTLGFGSGFNEDLLIGMSRAGGGNFYYIQSPDEAAEVFGIELESLLAVIAQDLKVVVETSPGVTLKGLLNDFRTTQAGQKLTALVGDVYESEDRQLLLELEVDAPAAPGALALFRLSWSAQVVTAAGPTPGGGELLVSVPLVTPEEAAATRPVRSVLELAARLRIARVKNEAVGLADKGDHKLAALKLQQTVTDLKAQALDESFELAEELDQLAHFATQLEGRRFDATARKEMRDQAHQAQSRGRADLKLRGLSSGSADTLAAVSDAGSGVVLKCEKEGGKLRVRVVSDGYDGSLHVQFPRAIREDGCTYLVGGVALSADGSFYRTVGDVQLLVKPGQEHAAGARSASRGGSTRAAPTRAPLAAPKTAADLETTTSVGTGVLVQCVAEGKKLRARVVSDGFNPDWNMRFPRSIRELGVLYVVDEVEEASGGGSYIAYGKIKRMVQ